MEVFNRYPSLNLLIGCMFTTERTPNLSSLNTDLFFHSQHILVHILFLSFQVIVLSTYFSTSFSPSPAQKIPLNYHPEAYFREIISFRGREWNKADVLFPLPSFWRCSRRCDRKRGTEHTCFTKETKARRYLMVSVYKGLYIFQV